MIRGLIQALSPDHDPYRDCLVRCNHDLGRGVRVTDVFTHDGPYADPPIVKFNADDGTRRMRVVRSFRRDQ